jgi:hypothetical protein
MSIASGRSFDLVCGIVFSPLRVDPIILFSDLFDPLTQLLWTLVDA